MARILSLGGTGGGTTGAIFRGAKPNVPIDLFFSRVFGAGDSFNGARLICDDFFSSFLGGGVRLIGARVVSDFFLSTVLGGGANVIGASLKLFSDFFFSGCDGGGAKVIGANPKVPSGAPNLCAPKPGEAGGLAKGSGGGNPGDMGGLERSSGAKFCDAGGFEMVRDAKLGGAKPGDFGGSANEPKPGDGGGLDRENDPKPGDGGGLLKVKEPPKPGEGGSLEIVGGTNPGDGGGLANELSEEANPESGCEGTRNESILKRPNFPGSDSSSFSVQEKLEGADDGPGEMGSPLFGVELPLALLGLRSGLPDLEAGSSLGSGAVRGSLGGASM